eukprot:6175312-Pleurochrysis_carterae.AAC.3
MKKNVFDCTAQNVRKRYGSSASLEMVRCDGRSSPTVHIKNFARGCSHTSSSTPSPRESLSPAALRSEAVKTSTTPSACLAAVVSMVPITPISRASASAACRVADLRGRSSVYRAAPVHCARAESLCIGLDTCARTKRSRGAAHVRFKK